MGDSIVDEAGCRELKNMETQRAARQRGIRRAMFASRFLSSFIGLVHLTISAWCCAQAGQVRARIGFDLTRQYQKIEGFGLNSTGPYFRDDQRQMFDRLMGDLGATMFRVVPYLVYSNWEETNDNHDPNVMNWEYYNDRYSTPIFEATWKGLRYLNLKDIRPVIALIQ